MTQDDTRWHEQLEAFILALGAETLACARVSHSSLHRRCKTDLQQSQAWYVDIMCIIMCITMCIIALHLLQQVFPWSTVRGGRLVNNRLKHVREREEKRQCMTYKCGCEFVWILGLCVLQALQTFKSWVLAVSHPVMASHGLLWISWCKGTILTGNRQWQSMAMNGNEWQSIHLRDTKILSEANSTKSATSSTSPVGHQGHQGKRRLSLGRWCRHLTFVSLTCHFFCSQISWFLASSMLSGWALSSCGSDHTKNQCFLPGAERISEAERILCSEALKSVETMTDFQTMNLFCEQLIICRAITLHSIA